MDDMIDTAGTITNAGKVLHEHGAKEVYACATHAVFSPPPSSASPRASSRKSSVRILGRVEQHLNV